MFLLKNNFSSIVLLYDQKYQKSARRTRAVLLPNHRGVHELVARAMRGKCVRQRGKGKIGSFTAPRNLGYTTRANIAHEEAEQIRARIVCTPAEKRGAGVGLVCALTEQSACFLFWILVALEFYLVGELTDSRSERGRRRRDWGRRWRAKRDG